MTRYRILSLDGGGIRGLLTVVLLQELEAAVPGWLDQVDLIAGTSTGGLIALGLAHGLAPADLRTLYYDKGPLIFQDSLLDDTRDLGRMLGAEYDTRHLSLELDNLLGRTALGDLNKKVLICAFDLDNNQVDPQQRTWKPKFFHNYEGQDSDGAMEARQVGLYTSAAPTYFPSVDGYIDGGVVANNPSMAALAQTQDPRIEWSVRPHPEDLVLLSIGTGKRLHHVKGQRHDWGYVQWARPLLDIMLDGIADVAHYQCQQLLRDRYCRISPLLPQPIDLDGWQMRDELVAIGKEVDLTAAIAWLREYWM
ncbi:MAG: patatin-like phospholipase family protein [Chloroflexota bacterium]